MLKLRATKTSEDRNRFVGTVLIILVLFVVFVTVLFWMYSVKLLTIPHEVALLLGFDTRDNDPNIQIDQSELAWMIKGERPEDVEGVTYELTYENLLAAIISEPVSCNFRQEVRMSYSEGETLGAVLYRNGDMARIERYELSEDEMKRVELMIYDRDSVYHFDDITGESRSLVRSVDVSPENAAGMPEIEKLVSVIGEITSNEETVETDEVTTALVDEVDSDAEFPAEVYSDAPVEETERWSELRILLKVSEIGNVYYVSFFDNYLATFEEYYLSLEHNTVLSHTVSYDGRVLYSVETVSFSTDAEVWDIDELYRPQG